MSKPEVKVARVISALWPGGVEKKLTVLLPKLRDRGADVQVICLKEAGELAVELEKQDIPVTVSKMSSRLSPFGLWRLRRLFIHEKLDVVHTHMYRSNTSGTIAAKLAGVPVIVNNIHNVDSWDNKRQIRTDRIVSRLRDCTILVSKGVAADYIEKVPIETEKSRIIYNGVDTDYFRPGDSTFVQHNGLIVGAAARLMPQKGLEHMVKAAAEPEFKDKNVKFVIAGDGPLKKDLLQRAEELNATSSFAILGFISEIREFYRSIDIFAMPSLKEGFSNALVEAMACGAAPVVTDVGGNGEAVQDGYNGRLVPSNNYPAFKTALSEMINSHEKRQMYSDNSLKTVQRFSLDTMADETMELYLTLLRKMRK